MWTVTRRTISFCHAFPCWLYILTYLVHYNGSNPNFQISEEFVNGIKHLTFSEFRHRMLNIQHNECFNGHFYIHFYVEIKMFWIIHRIDLSVLNTYNFHNIWHFLVKIYNFFIKTYHNCWPCAPILNLERPI